MTRNVHTTASTARRSNSFFWADHCLTGPLSFDLAHLDPFEPVKSLF
jgi:hypothetical protein